MSRNPNTVGPGRIVGAFVGGIQIGIGHVGGGVTALGIGHVGEGVSRTGAMGCG